ncbi:uncharacterized protein [Apostichopus japonicus]|uniref:uncharacterized protein n=1 Tax=Stichopus japonicus TaxID=307972 RepID=UPI003AB19E37
MKNLLLPSLVLLSIIAYSNAINCYYCDGGLGCADPYYEEYSKIQKIECTQHCFKDKVTDIYRDPITEETTERAFIRRGCSSSKCQRGCKDNEEGGRTCRSCCRPNLCNSAEMKTFSIIMAIVMIAVARAFVA